MIRSNKITFEFCSNSDIEFVTQAIEKWIKSGHILAKNQNLLDFQHKHKDGYSFFLAKSNDVLLGMLGFIPTYLYDDSLEKDLQYSTVMWFVDLDSKIPGLGMLLFRGLLTKKRPSFCYALGISDQAYPMHDALDYKVGWMNHNYLVNHKIQKFKLILNPPSSKKIISKGLYVLKKIQLHNFDKATLGFKESKSFVPTKSAIYFKNRFLNHPIYKYQVYGILKDKEIKSLFAIRLVSKNGVKAIRLVDFVGDPESLYSIAAELQELLLAKNAEYLDFYNIGLDQNILYKNGFLLRKKDSKTIVPNFFEPFESRNVELNYAYRYNLKNDNRHPLLFKADGDQDRPSTQSNFDINNDFN